MNNKKLNVGIVGYGVVGNRRRQCIDLNPNLETLYVSDISFEHDGEFSDGVKYYNDYRKVLNQDVDIIFISLPNYLAAEVTILGLESGCHVFCEKPYVRNVAEAKEIYDVSKKSKGILQLASNHYLDQCQLSF